MATSRSLVVAGNVEPVDEAYTVRRHFHIIIFTICSRRKKFRSESPASLNKHRKTHLYKHQTWEYNNKSWQYDSTKVLWWAYYEMQPALGGGGSSTNGGARGTNGVLVVVLGCSES